MKTILLTGASGFIGSYLTDYINSNYKDQYRLVLLTSREIPGQICLCHGGYTFDRNIFLQNDISQIELVLHVGAYVGSEQSSAQANASTIANTIHLLKSLPNTPQKLVLISSTALYGFSNKLPFVSSQTPISEETEVKPLRNYALAKYYCERLVTEYGAEKNCATQILRLGPVYGVDRNVGYLGHMINSAKKKEPFSLYAHPSQIYNYSHVQDVVMWIMNSLPLKECCGPINLVSSEHHTSVELCELMKKIAPKFDYTIEKRNQYYGKDFYFDSRKREELLGKSKLNLQQGLRQCLYNNND